MSKPSWGDWFEDARSKTKVLADKAFVIGQAATKIAHEGAVELGKQAKELREKYDLDVAAQAIISTLGGPQDTSSNNGFRRNVETRKSVLDVVYVTENLISMSFPYDYSKVGRRPGVEGNDINIVSKFLKQRHGSHFMIWNISEETYDYSYFGDQVLEYNFPGHPAPPLGLLFKICTSVENWLDADEKNVAVVHCLTGKGRTAALMSCILTWIGEFSSPVDALQYVAERRGDTQSSSVLFCSVLSQVMSILLSGARVVYSPTVRMMRYIPTQSLLLSSFAAPLSTDTHHHPTIPPSHLFLFT